jgi:hypothetical protein
MNEKSILGLTTSIIFATTIGLASILMQLQLAHAYVYNVPDAPIAASGDSVYVTWTSNRTGNYEVLFRESSDGGKTFGDKINLSNTTGSNSFHSDISAEGNNVHVSFHDNKTGNVDTYMITSTDGGHTFGDIVAINGTGTLPQKSKFFDIDEYGPPELDLLGDSMENTRTTTSGDNVYVVSWDKKSGNWEVFLARSTDNGKTFENTINLSNSSDTRSDRAMLASVGDNVYVSWWETNKDAKQEPVMRVSNDNGQTFGPVLKLASDGPIG